MKGTTPQEEQDEERQEMNELVDSDPELYAGDVEDMVIPEKSKRSGFQRERDNLKAELKGHLNNKKEEAGVLASTMAADNQVLAEVRPDEISLIDPEEEKEIMKEMKEKQSKIHNSFTGPYPVDPTEFGHRDTGCNYQFTTLTDVMDLWSSFTHIFNLYNCIKRYDVWWIINTFVWVDYNLYV